MPGGKVVILDGCGPGDQDLAPAFNALSDALERDGSQVQTFHLRQMKLAHCLGCFGCWVKTPGQCVENDAGRQIARAVIQSDTTVLFTPVTFGGYSPELKKVLDRFIQLISPYFQVENGEVHHPPRYARRPRLIVAGVQRHANAHEAHIFRTLAGRNAINLHPPSYAAEVVVAAEPVEALRQRFEKLLTRSDPLPFGDAAAALMPPPAVSGPAVDPASPRRALLIVGSPKTQAPSTSSILGSYLLERLGSRGWETELLAPRAALNNETGEAALLAAVNRAGLIVLAVPLYVDALPYLATKALTVMAARRGALFGLPRQRLAVILNSGFPETHQNAVAMAICEEFASQSRMAWAGGLALGGGGIIGTEPLTAPKRSGPPVRHVMRALDLAAEALAGGLAVPAAAVRSMAQPPVPLLPPAAWRWIYVRLGGKGFERQATSNGVGRDRLLDQPYAV